MFQRVRISRRRVRRTRVQSKHAVAATSEIALVPLPAAVEAPTEVLGLLDFPGIGIGMDTDTPRGRPTTAVGGHARAARPRLGLPGPPRFPGRAATAWRRSGPPRVRHSLHDGPRGHPPAWC